MNSSQEGFLSSPSPQSEDPASLILGFFHWNSLIAFFTVFFGYNAFSSLLQYVYYIRQESSPSRWKVQSKRVHHVGDRFWWLPLLTLFRRRDDRAPSYWLLCSLNITIASFMAAMTTELCLRGHSKMYWEIGEHGWGYYLGWSTFAPVVYENIAEYYWHRIMHLPFFYKRLHKYHHYYKSPEPFDDLYVHPLEVTGYYCILYGPPFLLTIHWSSFLLYMIVMGICGVTDHSGINFTLEGLYSSIDHDTHHLKFDCNYAFPFPFMDLLHGTFRGVFMGKVYGQPIKEHAAAHGFKEQQD